MSATTLKPGSVAIPAVAAAILYSRPRPAQKDRAEGELIADRQDKKREDDKTASRTAQPKE